MNKRGEEKILAIYWFVILTLVAGGIFTMTILFYNHPYDVREVESQILINNIADCLSRGGELNPELFEGEEFSEEFKTNFLQTCNLYFEAEGGEAEEYYSEITIYNASRLDLPVYEINAGNKNLVASCNIQEEKKYKREARCMEENLFSVKGGKLYLIKIMSAIGKAKENVK